MMMRTRGIKMKAKKEKKKITLREYHKKRMVTGIAILVTEIFENIYQTLQQRSSARQKILQKNLGMPS